MHKKLPVLSEISLSAWDTGTEDPLIKWVPFALNSHVVEESYSTIECQAPTMPKEETKAYHVLVK
eukprot:13452695-Ditylum_brightwellii.AAC.1